MYILQQHSYIQYEVNDTAAIAVSASKEALMVSIPGNWEGNQLVVMSQDIAGRTVPVNFAYEAKWYTISAIKEL